MSIRLTQDVEILKARINALEERVKALEALAQDLQQSKTEEPGGKTLRLKRSNG